MSVSPLGLECGIAAVTDLFGLSARAIRHYEAEGLVQPRRDALNRRRYGAQARARLAMIAQLRRAGLGIDEIRALIDEGDRAPDRLRENMTVAVRAQVGALEARLEMAQAVLAELESSRRPPSARPAHTG